METAETLANSNVQQATIAQRFENLHFNTVTADNMVELPASECSICQSSFQVGDRLVTAGCNH